MNRIAISRCAPRMGAVRRSGGIVRRHIEKFFGCAGQTPSANGGFTLLEMTVALGIFSVVIMTAVGAVIAVSDAQVKSAKMQSIQDNLRFALEAMTKEIRISKFFQPSGGMAPSYASLAFTRGDGTQVMYCADSGAIRKATGAGMNCAAGSAITDDSIVIEQLSFYVIGHAAGPSDGQPRITAVLKARSADPKLATSFRIQTTVTQRLRDN